MQNNFVFIKPFVLCIVLCMGFTVLHAQDVLVKKDGEQVKVKVIEIGSEEIRYKYFDAQDGPVVVINKREVKLIKLQTSSGLEKTIVIGDPAADPMNISNNAILDKTSSLKFNFFSPLNHELAFSYEWMIKPGFNWETGLGIVGPGISELDPYNGRGIYLRTGPKFLLGSSSDIEIQGARYMHPLKGRYFKVEAVLYSLASDYDADILYNYPSFTHANNSYLGAALELIYGRQFIFGNSITVGYYIGLGYAFESETTNFTGGPPISSFTDEDYKRYAFAYGGKDFPIAATAGFNIGYIFRTPYWLTNLCKPKVSTKQPSRHSLNND